MTIKNLNCYRFFIFNLMTSTNTEEHVNRKSAFSPEKYDTTGNISEAGTIWSNRIIKSLNLTKDMTVIDFGAGTGIIGRNLLPHVKKVIFEDISEGMLHQCQRELEFQKNKNFEIFLGEIKNYNGEKVDVIVSSLALHHAGDLEGTVKDILSKLKSKEKFAVCELVYESEEEVKAKGNKLIHHGIVPEKFVNLLSKCGFVNVKWEPANPVLLPNKGIDLRRSNTNMHFENK